MYPVLIGFVTAWFTICFFDIIFKTCMFYPYIHIMMTSGITIKPFYFKFYTTHFNRCIRRWVKKPKLIRLWFDAGALVTCLLILPAICLLFVPVFSLLMPYKEDKLFSQMLQPVVPGFNLPVSQIFYYLLTLLLCSILHEFGHALAAVRENVPVAGCGFFIFVLIPAAFVDISKEPLFCISTWQKLRIFSAGIWHNIVLSVCAILMLMLNPILLSPIFQQGNGVTTLNVQSSSLSSPTGLSVDDQVTMLNNCTVDNADTWKLCLKKIALNPQSGYCISKAFISTMAVSSETLHPPDCCGNSSTHLCFKHFDNAVEIHSCLPVRAVVVSAQAICKSNLDCSEELCVTPVLENDERLIVISRRKKPAVLFIGSPAEMFASVTISHWISKQNIVPVQAVHIYETFLKYIVSFSGALAVLNVIPCPGLDGQWLCQVLVDYLLMSVLPKRSHRAILVSIFQILGFMLLSVNIVLGFYRLMT